MVKTRLGTITDYIQVFKRKYNRRMTTTHHESEINDEAHHTLHDDGSWDDGEMRDADGAVDFKALYEFQKDAMERLISKVNEQENTIHRLANMEKTSQAREERVEKLLENMANVMHFMSGGKLPVVKEAATPEANSTPLPPLVGDDEKPI